MTNAVLSPLEESGAIAVVNGSSLGSTADQLCTESEKGC
jgi:hypothetical protein